MTLDKTLVGWLLLASLVFGCQQARPNADTAALDATRPTGNTPQREAGPTSDANFGVGSAEVPSSQHVLYSLPIGLRVIALEVDSEFIYLLASDAVYRAPKSGEGEFTRLSAAQHWIHSLSLSAGTAFFVSDGSIQSLQAASQLPALLFELKETARVWSLASAHRNVAVVTPGCGSVTFLSSTGKLHGSASQAVWDSVGGSVPVAAGTDSVFCSGGIGGITGSKIFRFQPTVGSIEPIADLGPVDAEGFSPEATALTELNDQVYFTRGYGAWRRKHSLEVIPTSGAAPRVLADVKGLAPHHLRYHERLQSFFWLTSSEPALLRYSLSTDAVSTEPITGLPGSSMALDDEHLYWSTAESLERRSTF